MPLDPQIALSAAQQPSFAQQAGQVYQLAGAIQKQQQAQQAQQDQQAIQQYLKQGGNFNTPEGLAKATESLKGIVSPNAYQTLSQAQSEMKVNEAKTKEYYAKMGPEVIANELAQQDFIAQNLEAPIQAYKKSLAEKKDPKIALQDYENAKAQVNAQLDNMPQVAGQQVINPAMRQRFMSMNPAEAESALQGTRYKQELYKSSLELHKKEQDIKTSAALETKYKREAQTGTVSNQPGGIGTNMYQDPATGQKYSVNTRSGKSWAVNEEGQYVSVNPNDVPKNVIKMGSIGTMGSREATILQREIQATSQASRDLENVASLPISVSTGWFGGRKQGESLLSATKEVLANKMTSQEVKIYNAMSTGFQRSLSGIEAAGMMPTGTLSHQMDAVLLKEGDDNLTKISKMAQIRQIVETGIEAIQANPRVSDSEKKLADKIQARLEKAVPFTQSDVIKLLHGGTGISMKQIMEREKKRIPASETGAEPKTGEPKAAPSAAATKLPFKNAKGWTLHTDAKGNKAYVGPNNEIEEVK